MPTELAPTAQDPAGAVMFGESGTHVPSHAHPTGAAPMDDLWLLPKMFRPSGYGRHQGEGEPLLGASWLNRPYYTGFFLGALHGDTLIPGEINQSIGFFGGFRLGWDYDTYWGLETRVGFSELGLDFIDEPSVDGLATDIVVWDASLVYHPWGDSRWRPYFSLGVGLVDYDFLDELGLRHSDAVVGLPWGVGLKYRQSDWIAMRFDLLDNVAFGGKAGFETMNNLSLTAGLEFRFGGTRKSYFPWNPSRTIR
ncbi:MAG: outer membrane beta-barrel protein [Pirellulales bacterium]